MSPPPLRLARCGTGILPRPSCASPRPSMDLSFRGSRGTCQRRERDAPATAGETPALLARLLPQVHVVEEDELQNQMVAGELLRQGREGDRSADACESRAVERVRA